MAHKAVENKTVSSAPAARRRSGRDLGLNKTRLKNIIEKLMDNLETDQISSKTSVSELIKLLHVYKELTAEEVKEVEVRWVDQRRADEEPGK